MGILNKHISNIITPKLAWILNKPTLIFARVYYSKKSNHFILPLNSMEYWACGYHWGQVSITDLIAFVYSRVVSRPSKAVWRLLLLLSRFRSSLSKPKVGMFQRLFKYRDDSCLKKLNVLRFGTPSSFFERGFQRKWHWLGHSFINSLGNGQNCKVTSSF